MTVLWRTGAAEGLETVGDVGAGGGAAVGCSLSLLAADAAEDFWMGERRMAPLGLTRPVPCTSPPAVRARMVPVLVRVMAALVAKCPVNTWKLDVKRGERTCRWRSGLLLRRGLRLWLWLLLLDRNLDALGEDLARADGTPGGVEGDVHDFLCTLVADGRR